VRVWFLTNGYGEDRAAALIATELRARRPTLAVVAAPLVTPGIEFTARSVPVAVAGTAPPSGGFPFASVATLVRDLPTVPAYLTYLRRLRRLALAGDQFVTAGDVFLTGVAHLAFGKRGVHVALAKSVHGQPHTRIERVLLGRWASLVFARDAETAAHLAAHGMRACFAGNPLVDHLAVVSADAATRARPGRMWSAEDGDGPWAGGHVLLLPGSRAEAPRNLVKLLEVAAQVTDPAAWVCAWPGALPIARAAQAAADAGWETTGTQLSRGNRTVALLAGQFESLLPGADVVVGLAGTANEQAAALGKPVVTFAGCGPQTTAARMEEQARLLGGAAQFVCGSASEVASAVSALLRAPAERSRRGALGMARLGPAGGAARIADHLIEELGL
jgi:tetraacyldisaccharide 4'-kinase